MASSCIRLVNRNQELIKIFDFLLGNVVVAETLKEGKQFSFKDARELGLHCRVVTKLGETISVDGNIAVSSDKGMGQPFQFSKLDEKKKRLEELSSDIISQLR